MRTPSPGNCLLVCEASAVSAVLYGLLAWWHWDQSRPGVAELFAILGALAILASMVSFGLFMATARRR